MSKKQENPNVDFEKELENFFEPNSVSFQKIELIDEWATALENFSDRYKRAAFKQVS